MKRLKYNRPITLTVKGKTHVLQQVEDWETKCERCSLRELCCTTIPQMDICTDLSMLESIDNQSKEFNFYDSSTVTEL